MATNQNKHNNPDFSVHDIQEVVIFYTKHHSQVPRPEVQVAFFSIQK